MKTNLEIVEWLGAKSVQLKTLPLKSKNGELKVKSLDRLPENEVRKELIQVKGIGPWTADMFLMFKLGRPDIFPS